MALCASNVVARNSLNLLRKNVYKQLVFNAARHLYSPSSMGMNGYLNARDYVKSQFLHVESMFFQKMKDFVDKKEDSMIFTEDLKTMLHLVEKKPEHLDLMYKMIKKYKTQNNLRFGSFVFGTVAMRAFYHLDEPDLALKAFKDPELDGFFDQLYTYQLLMDLLYNHGRYSEVREVYNIIKTKNLNGQVHPKNPVILVMGACYQENTAESFDYALNLSKELQERGFEFPRRAITFLAVLALKQNAPDIALEAAALGKNSRYIDIRCIKVEAYAKLKRIDEIMVYFRSSLYEDTTYRRKLCYFKDTIDKVQAFVKSENLDETSDLVKMLEQIKLHEYVQPGTLEEHITSEIEQIKSSEQRPWQKVESGNRYRYGNSQTSQYNNRRQNTDYERPGLRDIV